MVYWLTTRRWQQGQATLNSYTAPGWMEADVLHVTKAGYAHEMEVKQSRADFIKDSKKLMPESFGPWCEQAQHSGRTKHQALAERDIRGPSYFWFVAPEGVLTLADIPEFAGFIEMDTTCAERVIKPAPMLHKARRTAAEVAHIWRAGYYRFGHLRTWGAQPVEGPEYEI